MWRWLNGKYGDSSFDPQSLGAPWGDRPSIYGHVQRSIDPSSSCLASPHVTLPDETPVEDNRIRFSAGAMDGIAGHGFGETEASDVAKVVFTQLKRIVSRRDQRAFNVLHGYLFEHSALSYVDQLNPLLAEVIPEFGAQICSLGRYLLLNAADREVVKFAINLVGVCGGIEDYSALLTIGTHEEFTLFAVVAIGHAGGDMRAIWEMAKRVRGWGRIQCIERLDQEDLALEIKSWLLTEGYDNSILIEYTAAICARRGDLLDALSHEIVSRELIDSAADILAALARGEPGEGMRGYSESALATEQLLAIVEENELPSIVWLLASRDIETFAQTDSSDHDNSGGWTEEVCMRCVQAVARIRSRPVWHQVVGDGLQSEDEYQFNRAAEAAQLIGIDPWDHRFKRLLAGKDQWFWLLQTPDEARLDRVLEHAETHIDLNAITTGYGDALGFGFKYEEHRKLDWILQALQRWPGRGASLINAGFQSPVVRNRWGATRAVLRWRPEGRQPFLAAVQDLHRVEEDVELRAALARILAGEIEESGSEGAGALNSR